MPGDPVVQELVGALREKLELRRAQALEQAQRDHGSTAAWLVHYLRNATIEVPFHVVEALLSRAEAALDEGSGGGWRDMADAPRSRPVLLKMRADLQAITGRADLEHWEGRYVVCSWHGQVSSWGIAAPVGVGGFPDEWFVGWREAEPEAPPPPLPEGEG